jgi:hypothetical protein
VICVINLLYIILSKIFENDVNNEIGLELDILFLSPFLCSGVVIEYFNLDGKTPELSDVLIM